MVFINKSKLPLTDEIEAIVDLIKSKTDEFGIKPNSITKGSKTVTVEFQNGIEMDLLPACTFSQDAYKQYLSVLQCIKSYPENYFLYSSSLSDIQVKFLKDQPGLTHQLIRIVKYWYKSLALDVYGGSYLIEILCVAVCNEVESQNSLIINFKAALQKIATIDTLKVAFLLEKNKDGKICWKLLSEGELQKQKNVFSPFILERSRFIIDPTNPYNDLFNPKNLTETVVTKLKDYANEMLGRLKMLESSENNELKTVTTDIDPENDTPNVDVKLHIDKLFEPHSICLNSIYSDAGIPNEIVLDHEYSNPLKLKAANIDCTNNTFFVENKEAKKVSKTILTNLEFLIGAKARIVKNGLRKKYIFINGLPDVSTKDDVIDAVATFLRKNNFQLVRKSSSTRHHKKCNVTLYVPYVCSNTNLALRFSMKWNLQRGEVNNNFNGKNCCCVS